ncbi:hypothetical protein [Blochmannia endosymbiont of Camponotus (Colobopsis) obliquus]|uniref:hypothetical protein n=1 Tax=Blochmannia endosymbiont of Camponotus (Colobopsis) obliquus TaxID=1505597 RepID=UPI000695E5BF|nr:hypothetical protein [Blochmannia endosymbiont of Camponotus (Colobopsis) obliquus]
MQDQWLSMFFCIISVGKAAYFFLRDKIIGIIGLGNIGELLYKFLKLFGIETLLCDFLLQESGVNENW